METVRPCEDSQALLCIHVKLAERKLHYVQRDTTFHCSLFSVIEGVSDSIPFFI